MTGSKKRVRFAPSPTGGLHPGNARIAVFNWLYAKHYDAALILRVEDTDSERSTAEFERSIIDDLKWLGLDWSEGPIRQSDRLNKYSEVLDTLLKDGWLYPCYCTDEELDAERQAQLKAGKPPRYSGKCKKMAKQDKPHVLRFDVEKFVSSKGKKIIEFHDLIKNKDANSNLTSHASVIGDFVLVRENGTPTYNFAVVVDDSDMGITNVFRGDDHISNTFRQLMLFDVLKRPAPEYGHLPMLLAKDRTKLSKRSGGVPIHEYRTMGILPQAVFNHLAFLGGLYGGVDELASRDDLIKAFNYSATAVSASVYDIDKLYSINSKLIAKTGSKELMELMTSEGFINADHKKLYDDDKFISILDISKEGAKTLHDVVSALGIFINDDIDENCFNALDNDQKELLAVVVKELVEKDALKDGWDIFKNKMKGSTTLTGAKFFKTLRLAVTGRSWGPPLDDSMKLINPGVIAGRSSKLKKMIG